MIASLAVVNSAVTVATLITDGPRPTRAVVKITSVPVGNVCAVVIEGEALAGQPLDDDIVDALLRAVYHLPPMRPYATEDFVEACIPGSGPYAGCVVSTVRRLVTPHRFRIVLEAQMDQSR